jgi:6-pyruvoyltetrahydropterin/6-carboxytetrahydropterin synthase
MLTTIAKDFNWEMGHRLPYHEAGCRNIHGHSYKMRVELTGTLDEQGMLMDYGIMKKLIDPLVERFDHAFACDENDKPMLNFFKENVLKVQIVPFYTTAENLAHFFLQEIRALLKDQKNITKITVRLQETERTFAETSVEL